MTLEAALQGLKINRKAKRLQRLWPTIEAKLAEGVSHCEILALLNDSGFDLTERTYKSYLYRYRKRRRTTGQGRNSMRLKGTTSSQTADMAHGAASSASSEAQRHKRPPTFDYDPRGIPDLLK